MRQLISEVVAQIPAQAQAVGHHPHELALGAQVLEEEDELELEEDDGIDRWSSAFRVVLPDPVADE